MRLLETAVIALMTGCIGAGLVWFGWGFAENVGTLMLARRLERKSADTEIEEPEENPKTEE